MPRGTFPAGPDARKLDGMTLRDEFAAQTLAGLLARYHSAGTGMLAQYETLTPELAAGYAADAYLLADAMLVERSKPIATPERQADADE